MLEARHGLTDLPVVCVAIVTAEAIAEFTYIQRMPIVRMSGTVGRLI